MDIGVTNMEQCPSDLCRNCKIYSTNGRKSCISIAPHIPIAIMFLHYRSLP